MPITSGSSTYTMPSDTVEALLDSITSNSTDTMHECSGATGNKSQAGGDAEFDADYFVPEAIEQQEVGNWCEACKACVETTLSPRSGLYLCHLCMEGLRLMSGGEKEVEGDLDYDGDTEDNGAMLDDSVDMGSSGNRRCGPMEEAHAH